MCVCVCVCVCVCRYICLQIPVTYPATCPEIELPELDGKTPKMFRGGKICLEGHFKQLWGAPH